MNDFHNLSVCIEKKDKHAAMMVFRNKSEFAARKILEKIKVREISGTGKIFWHNVQRWLLAACSQEIKPVTPVGSSCSTVPVRKDIVESLKTAPGGGYPDWLSKKPAPGLSPSADVCAWPEGLPPVHAYMADGPVTSSQTFPCVIETPADKRPPLQPGLHATLQPHRPGRRQDRAFRFASITQRLVTWEVYGRRRPGSNLRMLPVRRNSLQLTARRLTGLFPAEPPVVRRPCREPVAIMIVVPAFRIAKRHSPASRTTVSIPGPAHFIT